MSAPAPRLLPAKQPRQPDQRTPEQRYWRSFKVSAFPYRTLTQTPAVIRESGSITHTHFSPTSPHTLAISASARVQLYNPSSRSLVKTLSRFKDTALCAEFRQDGKLLLASDKSGAIQVFDLSSRAILRQWTPEEAHERLQVTKVTWSGLTNVVSVGDDKCAKLWDITSKSPVQTFTGHTDYVRALSTVSGTNLILSGSLDGTARLWDPRAPDAEVAVFNHGSQSSGIVYTVLPLRGGMTFMTAGGSGIKIWDMTAGTKYPVKEMWNHQKEVTALCHNANGSRVLAGGLDGHIKIYDVSTWKVVHGVKYPAPILTVSLSVYLIKIASDNSPTRSIWPSEWHLLCCHYVPERRAVSNLPQPCRPSDCTSKHSEITPRFFQMRNQNTLTAKKKKSP
jgi:U3 small nucleolar RNA-associated protein 15